MSMVPIAIVHASGQAESYLEWMVFTAIIISGTGSILQATRFGRIGSGQLSLLATSAMFIPISIETLTETGPSTLATLALLSAPLNFFVSAHLPKLRRIITPLVAGSVLMLLGASFMPPAFELLHQVPDGKSGAALLTAGLTVFAVLILTLRGRGYWRLWTLVIAISVGCITSMFLGMYDFDRIADAAWIGLPSVSAWPGFDLSFDTQFWALFTVFLLVTFANTIKTIASAILIEQVSWRTERPPQYKTVQGALNSDGITSVLSGVAGTPANTILADSAPFITFTGVAARRIGVLTGLMVIAVAFLPKAIAPLLAIPNPVVGALFFIFGALIFVQGFRIASQDGLDQKKATIIGASVWLGIAFQSDLVLPPSYSTGIVHILFGNGVMVGGLTALVLTGLTWLFSAKHSKLDVTLHDSSLEQINQFLADFASKIEWTEEASYRLRAAGEEALTSLINAHREAPAADTRKLLIIARDEEGVVELEFICGPLSENLESQLANLSERPYSDSERDISLRLLHHYASSVRHRSYHNIDIVTIQLDPSE